MQFSWLHCRCEVVDGSCPSHRQRWSAASWVSSSSSASSSSPLLSLWPPVQTAPWSRTDRDRSRTVRFDPTFPETDGNPSRSSAITQAAAPLVAPAPPFNRRGNLCYSPLELGSDDLYFKGFITSVSPIAPHSTCPPQPCALRRSLHSQTPLLRRSP